MTFLFMLSTNEGLNRGGGGYTITNQSDIDHDIDKDTNTGIHQYQ